MFLLPTNENYSYANTIGYRVDLIDTVHQKLGLISIEKIRFSIEIPSINNT